MTCGVKTLNCARWSVRCSRTQGRQQFLAVKGLVLTCEARETFLDWLYEDLAAALRRLIRVALGDYTDDKYLRGSRSSTATTAATRRNSCLRRG
jgi:hypothetical protein